MSDTSNTLYRPPQARVGEAPPPGYAGTGSFEISQCLSQAWSATRRNLWTWLGLLLVLTLAVVGLGFVLGALMAVSPIAAAAFVAVFYLLAGPLLGWGCVRYLLNAVDGQGTLGNAFSGFERLRPQAVSLWIAMVVVALPNYLPQVMQWADADLALQGLAVLVSILWTVLVGLRVYFAFFFLVDREQSAREALRSSWEATRGHTFGLIALASMAAVIILGGIVALLIGIIPAMLMVSLMYASAYRQLAGRPAL